MTPSNRMEFRLYPIFLLGGSQKYPYHMEGTSNFRRGAGVNGLEFQVGGWRGGGGSVLDFQKGITVSQIKHKL